MLGTDSGQALQRLSLPGAALPTTYAGENVLLLLTEEEQAAALTALALENGQYSLFLSCPCDETLPGARFLHSAFDGTRLAVADFSRYLGPSFSLWIYGQDGLLYAGQYLSDIATASDPPSPTPPPAGGVAIDSPEKFCYTMLIYIPEGVLSPMDSDDGNPYSTIGKFDCGISAPH